jgi:hypothetical protein
MLALGRGRVTCACLAALTCLVGRHVRLSSLALTALSLPMAIVDAVLLEVLSAPPPGSP